MTDKHWITDRPPTEADADQQGDVTVCTSPTLHKEARTYANWRDVTPGWPWRHTDYWTPPTPAPELTPAAPEFKVGQVWRTRGGRTCRVEDILVADPGFPIQTDLYSSHYHDLHGKSILGEGTDCEDDLIELISENPPTPAAPKQESKPKPAARGFKAFTRVVSGSFRIDSAVGTDNTAWVRYCNISNEVLMDWQQVDSLPQPGEE